MAKINSEYIPRKVDAKLLGALYRKKDNEMFL
jgi:hypothetical protein